MKKYITFLFLFSCLLANGSMAQHPVVDSLSRRLKKLQKQLHFEKDTQYIKNLTALANTYRPINADTALHLAELSLRLTQAIGYKKGEYEALLQKARIRANQGIYSEAIKISFELVQIAEKTNDTWLLIESTKTLARGYGLKRDREKAIFYCERVLQILAQKQQENETFYNTHNNLGDTYRHIQNYEKALKHYQIALIGAQKINDKRLVAIILNNIGLTLYDTNKFQQAEEYLNKSKEIAEKIDYFPLLSESLQGLARCALQKNEHGHALAYAQRSLDCASRAKHKLRTQNAHFVLCEVYKHRQDFAKALQHYELGEAYKDSLYNMENERKIATLQAEYEFNKKEENLKIQNEQKLRIQRAYLYASLAVLGAVIVVAFLIYRSKQKEHHAKEVLAIKNTEINQQNEEMAVQAENLQLAYNQLQDLEHFKESMLGMIVHDLKNPLNAILHQEEDRKSRTYHIANQMMDLVLNILDIQKYNYTQLELQLQPYNLLNITELAVQQVDFLITDKNILFQN